MLGESFTVKSNNNNDWESSKRHELFFVIELEECTCLDHGNIVGDKLQVQEIVRSIFYLASPWLYDWVNRFSITEKDDSMKDDSNNCFLLFLSYFQPDWIALFHSWRENGSDANFFSGLVSWKFYRFDLLFLPNIQSYDFKSIQTEVLSGNGCLIQQKAIEHQRCVIHLVFSLLQML